MESAAFTKLLTTLEIMSSELTKPGFCNMIVIAIGWILDPGAVTFALVATSISGQTHHEKFHRFFSRGTWQPDKLGRLIFIHLLGWLEDGAPVRIAVDDTLAGKTGEKVFGIDSHLDAVRSTKKRKFFSFGHCWVFLTIQMPMPFCSRCWALPFLFRLYRNKKTCLNKKEAYDKKTELAREMIELVVRWADGRQIELLGDSGYSCSTVIKGLPGNVVCFGSMRPDAVITALPDMEADEQVKDKSKSKGQKGGAKKKDKKKRPGPKPKRGKKLPKPQELAKDESHPWLTCMVNLNGKEKRVTYKDYFGQWYRACGFTLLHIVVVFVPNGKIPYRVFFSTNAELSVQDILSSYSFRWSIEVCFCDLKQYLGFADSSARKKESLLRTAPFVGLLYSIIVIWFVENKIYNSSLATPPTRPWYGHKKTLSFEDVLRAARRAILPQPIFDLPQVINNLHNYSNHSVMPSFAPKEAGRNGET